MITLSYQSGNPYHHYYYMVFRSFPNFNSSFVLSVNAISCFVRLFVCVLRLFGYSVCHICKSVKNNLQMHQMNLHSESIPENYVAEKNKQFTGQTILSPHLMQSILRQIQRVLFYPAWASHNQPSLANVYASDSGKIHQTHTCFCCRYIHLQNTLNPNYTWQHSTTPGQRCYWSAMCTLTLR